MIIGSYQIEHIDEDNLRVTHADLNQTTIVCGGDLETALSTLFINNVVEPSKETEPFI